jgi:hypothetical protein
VHQFQVWKFPAILLFWWRPAGSTLSSFAVLRAQSIYGGGPQQSRCPIYGAAEDIRILLRASLLAPVALWQPGLRVPPLVSACVVAPDAHSSPLPSGISCGVGAGSRRGKALQVIDKASPAAIRRYSGSNPVQQRRRSVTAAGAAQSALSSDCQGIVLVCCWSCSWCCGFATCRLTLWCVLMLTLTLIGEAYTGGRPQAIAAGCMNEGGVSAGGAAAVFVQVCRMTAGF